MLQVALVVASATSLQACEAVKNLTELHGEPDIAVLAVQPTGIPAGTIAKVKAGTDLPVTITYSDTGSKTADFVTKVCLTGYYGDCDVPVIDLSTPGLPSGDERSDQVTLAIPTAAMNPSGDAYDQVDEIDSYRIYVCADASQVISEGNEYNNCAHSDDIHVLPNFELACGGAPALIPGQPVSGTFSSTNCHIGAAGGPSVVYSLTVATPGTRTLELSFSEPDGNGWASLAVVNAQGDLVAERGSGDAIILSVPLGIAGTYYVAVNTPAAFTLTMQ